MWSVSAIIGLLIAGIILGILGRLLAPGRQAIPFWLTILAGIVGALVGNLVAGWTGVAETDGFDWWRHIFQVIAAVIAVVLAASLYPKARART
ncbi:GlsB/YeaQ/YmgE family stress response membrane protein [Actinophytocola gossypii]|uniref:GlsB/YeaQ/YmgE family stress response membrane protein n=1 Tax=Actinophytocola gossypii TaxID=2812003 RepID=A0ABT2JDV1_9PSEU|nr:GlsB/YeaQ/YmgE family stress response membrane protein [Actinophytocola gossypii]MCT2586058.1 GlsB/YeaQ/YmgE family stress response membrane protein [Actinophytocola gossypii]